MQFVLLLVTIIGIMCLGTVCAQVWGRVRRLQIEADLKTDLLERGLSVAEIREVLAAPMRGKQQHEVEADLKARLAEMGLDGSQIKQVLEAGQPYWSAAGPHGWKCC
jgi:hypothetical protein